MALLCAFQHCFFDVGKYFLPRLGRLLIGQHAAGRQLIDLALASAFYLRSYSGVLTRQ